MNDSKNPLSPHLQIYRWHVSSLVKIHDVKDKSFVGLSMNGVKSYLQFDNIESAFVEIKY